MHVSVIWVILCGLVHAEMDLFDQFGPQKRTKEVDPRFENSVQKSRIEGLSETFRKRLEYLKEGNKKEVELIFLIDGSSSVGEENFQNELKFVRKLVADFTVGPNATKVAIVVFATEIVTYVNHLDGTDDHEKCSLLHLELPRIKYLGGNTFTLGALQEAAVILNHSRPDSRRALFLITDGFSNNGDPIPVAAELKRTGVKLFTFGIRSGNVDELYRMSSPPSEEHAFLLESFSEFEALARRALHQDLPQGVYTPVLDRSLCSNLCNQTDVDCCNENATCSCGSLSGHFGCLCPPGYYGSGLTGEPCLACPKGSYSDGTVPGDSSVCRLCPDRNQNTKKYPATGIHDCICNDGFVPVGDKCEVVTCPMLEPPRNGYFVKENCSNVLNAACGVRCGIGYILNGSSVRICQKNATWTGITPKCIPKRCTSLKAVQNGEVHCTHDDEGFEVFIKYGEAGEIKKEVVKRKPSDGKRVFGSEKAEGYIVDTECRFGCPVGFVLVGSKLRTCLPVTRWDGLQATCKPITCPAIPKITHGNIEPQNCTRSGLKHGYGAICQVSCEPGYTLRGNSTRHCTGKHGTWSGKAQPYKCLDTEAPNLVCPANIVVTTEEGSSYATVNLTLPVVTDNSGVPPIVWSKPPVVETSHFSFPIGSSEVQILAIDASGNLASCSFSITVNDTESPVIENCESPEPMTLATLLQLHWEEPLFSDNSGNVTVERSHEVKGLTNGTTIVTYRAFDASGNEAFCLVNLTLLDNVCTLPPTHHNADVTCTSSGTETVCQVFCKPGFTSVVPNATLTCVEARWIPDSSEEPTPLPECSENVVPAEVIQTGEIVLESNDSFCNEGEQVVMDLDNELSVGLGDRGVELKMECMKEDEEEESNAIWTQRHSKRKRRSNARRQKLNFSLLSRSGKFSGNPYQMFSNLKSSGDDLVTYFNSRDSILVKGNPVKIKIVETKNLSIKCHDGSVPVSTVCVKCSLGKYFNKTSRSCSPCSVGFYQDKEGQMECKACPLHFTTIGDRKTLLSDCKRICPPGSFGTRVTPFGVALAPCRRCPYGQFQILEGQSKCQSCQGAFRTSHPPQCPSETFCTATTCKNNGTCFADRTLTCLCTEGYLGAFCEKTFNPCDSSPCLNGGTCFNITSILFGCTCSEGYEGNHCQIEVDACLVNPCSNGGDCSSKSHGFHCDCPAGFYGDTCSEVIDTCLLTKPCLNNGTCNNKNGGVFDCSCPRPFYGRYCDRSANCLPEEDWCCQSTSRSGGCSPPNISQCNVKQAGLLCTQQTPTIAVNLETTLTFPKCSATDYMIIDFDLTPMKHVSACLWVQTADSFNFGTLFSYATATNDNEFTLTDYNGFVLYVLGKRVVTDVIANDGLWHLICVTWRSAGGEWHIYLDGKVSAYGSNLAPGLTLDGTGKLVVGQEQDRLGGGFNEVESFVGKMTQVEMWNKVLSQVDIEIMVGSCEEPIFKDSLNIWPELLRNIRGNIKTNPSTFCRNCGSPPPIFRADVTVEGTEATYNCTDGFQMKFPREHIQVSSKFWVRKCLKTGEWEANQPTCTRVSCGSPGFLPHGTIIGRSYLFEDVVRYQCHNEYVLVGPSRRICLTTGIWSGETPRCRGTNTCDPLTAPRRGALFILSQEPNGMVRGAIGDKIEFTCDPGYHLHGDVTLTCMPNGEWDHQKPVCSSCATPQLPQGVTWNFGTTPDQIHLKCNKTGESESISCTLGSWNISADFCKIPRDPCPSPKPPQHGYFLTHTRSMNDKFVGDFVYFGCRYGYQMSGVNLITCLEDRTWNISNSSCQPVRCGPSTPATNAEYLDESTDYKYGDVVSFRCVPGYQIFGTPTVRCEAEGRWSRARARCIRIFCGRPASELGLSYNGTSFLFEDVLEVVCPNGRLRNITCQMNGSWSSPHCSQ